MTKEKVILGIDPGTNILGYGIVRVDAKGPHYVDMGVFDLRKIGDPFEKLANIFAGVGELLDVHKPDELAVESPFYGKNGHIAIETNYLERAIYHLEKRGVEFDPETKTFDADGTFTAIYLKCYFGGFALHLVQKK